MNDVKDIAAAVQGRGQALLDTCPEPTFDLLDPRKVKQCLDDNERGDGILFSELHSGRYLYNVTPKDGEWYTWSGNVWTLDETRRAHAAVEDVALQYQGMANILRDEIREKGIVKKITDDNGHRVDHPEAWKITLKDKYKARAERLRSANGATKVLHWAPIVDLNMACRESDFDKHPWLLPVKNGVVDLRTGVLTQGQPQDRLTRTLDIDYDPHADYQPFIDFLHQVTGDAERGTTDISDFLARTFGYAATGHSHEQFIWVFTGPGRNGKGTLFELIADVLGPYYHPISRAMLIEQRNEQSPSAASEHKYSLLGKRIIVGDETNKGQKIDASAIKSLTGEDRITCRPLFKSEITFRPTHTLFLHTNHVPVGLTKDFALIQRLLKVEFPYMYVDDPAAEGKKNPVRAHLFRKKDPDLKDKLRGCKQGILRWIVEGCLAWQAQGLKPPQTILQAVTDLAKEEDYLGQFYDDCIDHYPDDPNTRISCGRVYEAFRWWWAQNMDDREKRTPALKSITSQLRERGHKIEKVGGKYWLYGHQLAFSVVDDVDEYAKKHGGKS